MRLPFAIVFLLLLAVGLSGAFCAEPEKRDWQAVELVGRAADYWHTRNWNSYYWREEFTFVLGEESSGKSWRVISREPTPAYDWRMGTTFTGLKVDWQSRPKVKVLGIQAVDRIPAEFYDFKLDEKNLVTTLIVFVETEPGKWKEFYVNNWCHHWGDKADRLVFGFFADKPAPYDIYGFARGFSAPFDAKSQAIIDRHKDNPSLMFHGRVKSTKENEVGYEVELIDLIGRNVQTGGAVILHGDAKSIPLLDTKKL